MAHESYLEAEIVLCFPRFFATKVANILRLGKKRINSFVLLSTFRNFSFREVTSVSEKLK